jgi:hypothetical protein
MWDRNLVVGARVFGPLPPGINHVLRGRVVRCDPTVPAVHARGQL